MGFPFEPPTPTDPWDDGACGPHVPFHLTAFQVEKAKWTRYPRAAFERRVGSIGFIVWSSLVGLRDCEGKVHITREGIARRCAGVSVRQVCRALMRLKDAGVVVPLGKRWRWVNHGTRTRRRVKVFERRIVGEFDPTDGQRSVRIPREVQTWCNCSHTHGGDRKGRSYWHTKAVQALHDDAAPTALKSEIEAYVRSGMKDPKRIPGLADRFDSSKIQDSGQQQANPLDFKAVRLPTPPADQTGSPSRDSSVSSEIVKVRRSSSKNASAPRGPFPSDADTPAGPLFGRQGNVAGTPSKIEALGPEFDGLSIPEKIELLEKRRAAVPPRDMKCGPYDRSEWPILPGVHHPPVEWIQRAGDTTYPPFPDFGPGMNDHDRATIVHTAYRAAVNRRYPARRIQAPRNLATSPAFRTVEAAAKAMFDHDVPPYPWAMWSVDQWAEMAASKGGTKPPPLRFVLSVDRLRRLRGMFARDAGFVVPAVPAPALMRLWHRHMRMQAALAGESRYTVQVQQAIVDRFFPRDSFDRALAVAKNEIATAQHGLRVRVSRGEWIWS